jgi:hypothetical protein
MWMAGVLCTTGLTHPLETPRLSGLRVIAWCCSTQQAQSVTERSLEIALIHQVDPTHQQAHQGLSGGHCPAEPAGCVDQLGAGGQPVIARLLADATSARPP